MTKEQTTVFLEAKNAETLEQGIDILEESYPLGEPENESEPEMYGEAHREVVEQMISDYDFAQDNYIEIEQMLKNGDYDQVRSFIDTPENSNNQSNEVN
jgi:hypothetical protein